MICVSWGSSAKKASSTTLWGGINKIKFIPLLDPPLSPSIPTNKSPTSTIPRLLNPSRTPSLPATQSKCLTYTQLQEELSRGWSTKFKNKPSSSLESQGLAKLNLPSTVCKCWLVLVLTRDISYLFRGRSWLVILFLRHLAIAKLWEMKILVDLEKTHRYISVPTTPSKVPALKVTFYRSQESPI